MSTDTFNRGVRSYKGTRDYAGDAARWRLLVVSTIESVFQQFGFEPLETPAIENERTLKGKYGEEGEAKRFKLALPFPDEAGLRYDHTVPLARYLAINASNLVKPYRRYVIGSVWRNEDPAAGRLRQFTQCDFDTAGTGSPVVDAEIAAMFSAVLNRLGFPSVWEIQINDRRLLNAMVQPIDCKPNQAIEIFRAWDKLEKASLADITKELFDKGFDGDQVTRFENITRRLLDLPTDKALDGMKAIFGAVVNDSIAQLRELNSFILAMGVDSKSFRFVPTLARGLDYYTGPIFEVVVNQKGIGSIAGGGRYDNLVAALGGPELPASGASFGLERLMSVMEDLGLKPESTQTTDVFVTLWDITNPELTRASFEVANNLRLDGYRVEVYTGDAGKKLAKQLDICRRKLIPKVIIIGPDEMRQGVVIIKDMTTGGQQIVNRSEVSSYLE